MTTQRQKLAKQRKLVICCDTYQKTYYPCKTCGKPVGYNRKTYKGKCA